MRDPEFLINRGFSKKNVFELESNISGLIQTGSNAPREKNGARSHFDAHTLPGVCGVDTSVGTMGFFLHPSLLSPVMSSRYEQGLKPILGFPSQYPVLWRLKTWTGAQNLAGCVLSIKNVPSAKAFSDQHMQLVASLNSSVLTHNTQHLHARETRALINVEALCLSKQV